MGKGGAKVDRRGVACREVEAVVVRVSKGDVQCSFAHIAVSGVGGDDFDALDKVYIDAFE